jgi:hypothetical protein
MTEHAEARKLEEISKPQLSPTEHAARTAQTVAAGHDGELHRALASVSWERRGLLGVLRRRPRPRRIPETAA